jgi:hypothetical protein
MAVPLYKLKGWWKLTSAWHEREAGPIFQAYGAHPQGSLVFGDDHQMMWLIVASWDGAPPGYDIDVYSGRYRIDGSDLVTVADVSKKLGWNNGKPRYSLSLSNDDNTLFLTSAKQTGPLYSGTPFIAAFQWTRVQPGQKLAP